MISADEIDDVYRLRPNAPRGERHPKSSYSPRPSEDDLEPDYASKISRLTAKNRLMAPEPRDSIVINLVLDGVPVVALVLAVMGVAWLLSALSSKDTRYLFPAGILTVGFLMLYFLSQNVRRRYKRSRYRAQSRISLRRATQ